MTPDTITINSQNPTMEFAKAELVRYLNMLPLKNGSSLPCRITLSANLPQDSGNDAFSYSFTQESGFIAGNSPRAVLLGVYDYLRSLGFQFYRPGEDGTFVPEITDSLDLLCGTVTKTADFRHRGVCIEGADSISNVLEFIDWLPKNGFNTFFVQFKKPDVFFERWYNHTFNPLLAEDPQTREQLDAMEQQVTQAMSLRGILNHRVGHGWTAEAIGFDNTGWHVEDGTLPPETQELIAQIDGKRSLFGGVPTNTNLCYANPEARRRLIDQVTAYAKAHPSVNYLHFWLADEHNNVCECPQCRETTLSDQYISILNDLDSALTREGLDTKIVFLLYQELLYAPIHEKLSHPERFCMMFAPISRTFEKSYPHTPGNAEIKPYVRNQFQLPETVEENLAHYFSWKQVFTGDSFFYDYPLGRAHYGDFGYMKIARVIYDDIHALKDLQADGYMSCQELRAMNPTGFPNYVMGQSLLDSSLSYESLKETYFRSMFGQGFEAVICYLEQLSEYSDTDYFNGHGPRRQPEKRQQFLAIAETAMGFLMDMDGLHPDEAKYRANWEFLKFHGRYTILLSCALAELCDGKQATADQYFKEFCGYIQENETRWQPLLDVYRVIEVATKYTGFSQI